MVADSACVRSLRMLTKSVFGGIESQVKNRISLEVYVTNSEFINYEKTKLGT